MKYLKNERGMTLVIVLLTITVFSVLGLAVVGASVTNVKQVTKVESDIKTTDIAEMGIQYYEAQIKGFLNTELYDQDKLKEIMNRIYNGSMGKDKLIEEFTTRIPIELNNAFKANPSIFTIAADRFLAEKTVAGNSKFKIKINPSGIVETVCDANDTSIPSGSQCFRINFESHGFQGQNPEKQLSATYTFSFKLDPASIDIVPSIPPLVPLHENLLKLIEDKNLKPCTKKSFDNNYTVVECSSNLEPGDIPSTNGISNSFIVFNKGVSFEHLSHAVSNSTIFIYATSTLTPTIGKFNPNGFIGSQIVIIGDAILNDKIMKPQSSSIHVTGNANLKDFELKDPDVLTKVCVKGIITPASQRTHAGVYSFAHDPVKYRENCMETENTIGVKSLVFKSQILNPRLGEKSEVTY